MTLLFSREPAECPATHAFVLGVGGYRHAQEGKGALDDLIADDVPSAADSARYFCDWLLRNRDNLIAPLASLEMLLSDTNEGDERYCWAPDLPPGQALPESIDPATSAALMKAGGEWLARVNARPGDVALFYCCGHGASLRSEPVLFLADLNEAPNNPWACVNLRRLGTALSKNSTIRRAYLFVDACGELVPGFSLADAQDTRFWPAPAFDQPEIPKTLLYCAAPAGLLAYEGEVPGSRVRLGRFTQTLVKALDGAAAESWRQEWAVKSSGLGAHLKDLHHFYFPGWADQTFEPAPIMGFNDIDPFVRPVQPVVPVLAKTNPAQAMADYALCVGDDPPPPRPAGQDIPPDRQQQVWRFELQPRNSSVYAIAYNQDAFHFVPFTPNRPCFDLQVDIT